MPARHWSARYVADRVGEEIYRRRHPGEPWLTQAAISILDRWLRPSDVAAEFGSGRSTAWFARRVGHLTSVEHDPVWYEQVRADPAVAHVDYLLMVDTEAYVGVARSFPASSLHFALVDGAHRDRCVDAIIHAIKPGGLLTIDNANWYMTSPETRSPHQLWQGTQAWKDIERRLSLWRLVWTTNGVTDTALFFRPA